MNFPSENLTFLYDFCELHKTNQKKILSIRLKLNCFEKRKN